MKITLLLAELMMLLMWRDIVFNFRNGRNCITHQSAECAVIGINDALKGQIPLALVVTIK
jgi:hypothetical protein